MWTFAQLVFVAAQALSPASGSKKYDERMTHKPFSPVSIFIVFFILKEHPKYWEENTNKGGRSVHFFGLLLVNNAKGGRFRNV